MLKNVNRIIIVLFVVLMGAILLFFQKCSLDIYALLLAFAVALMAIFTSYHQIHKLKDLKKEGKNIEKK